MQCPPLINGLSPIQPFEIDDDALTSFGETKLMLAATTGSTPLMKYFLSKNVDVHAKDHLGYDVLHHLCYSGGMLSPSLVENILLLVGKGLSINTCVLANFTVLDLVIDQSLFFVVPFRLLAILRSLNAQAPKGAEVVHYLCSLDAAAKEDFINSRRGHGRHFVPFVNIVRELIEGELVGENEALYSALLSGSWSPTNHAALCRIDPSLHAIIYTTFLCLPSVGLDTLLSFYICSLFTEQMRLEGAFYSRG